MVALVDAEPEAGSSAVWVLRPFLGATALGARGEGGLRCRADPVLQDVVGGVRIGVNSCCPRLPGPHLSRPSALGSRSASLPWLESVAQACSSYAAAHLPLLVTRRRYQGVLSLLDAAQFA